MNLALLAHEANEKHYHLSTDASINLTTIAALGGVLLALLVIRRSRKEHRDGTAAR